MSCAAPHTRLSDRFQQFPSPYVALRCGRHQRLRLLCRRAPRGPARASEGGDNSGDCATLPLVAERLPVSLRSLADALSELVAQHLRLARLEASRDARALGVDVALLCACALVAAVGYVFLCVSLALALSTVIPEMVAFGALGLGNVAAAAAVAARAAARLRSRRVAEATITELRTSVARLTGERGGTP